MELDLPVISEDVVSSHRRVLLMGSAGSLGADAGTGCVYSGCWGWVEAQATAKAGTWQEHSQDGCGGGNREILGRGQEGTQRLSPTSCLQVGHIILNRGMEYWCEGDSGVGMTGFESELYLRGRCVSSGRLFAFLSLWVLVPKVEMLPPTEMMSLEGLVPGRGKILSGCSFPLSWQHVLKDLTIRVGGRGRRG